MKIVPIVLALSISLIVFACGKDKFETKPLIEIRSISTKELSPNGILTIKLDFFDKEGDLGTGDFFAAKLRLNQLPLGTSSPDLVDSFYYTLPEFQPRDKGEISLQLEYSRLKESINENDTIMFRLAVTDAAGNKSDTISSEPIVILLP
jgi:hypothetical protein